MRIRLKCFAVLADRFGGDERELKLEAPLTAGEIFLRHFDDREEGNRMLRFTRLAVNCEYVPPETVVKDGDEVAFIPPVSGG